MLAPLGVGFHGCMVIGVWRYLEVATREPHTFLFAHVSKKKQKMTTKHLHFLKMASSDDVFFISTRLVKNNNFATIKTFIYFAILLLFSIKEITTNHTESS